MERRESRNANPSIRPVRVLAMNCHKEHGNRIKKLILSSETQYAGYRSLPGILLGGLRISLQQILNFQVPLNLVMACEPFSHIDILATL